MDNQLQTLKLNVTNINSYLMRSNNQLQKLKKNKNQLLFKLERQSIGRKKETKIEKGLIGKGIMKTGSKLLSPAMSIFDKIKEFFGIVILGFIVNKLPKIIKAITDFLDSEFVKNLKSVVSVIGNTFTTLYNIVTDFPKIIRDNFEDNIKKIQNDLDWLNKTFGTESDLFKGILSLFGNEEDQDEVLDLIDSEMPSLSDAIPSELSGDAISQTKQLLRKSEGFREMPYYDVNAFRAGYGSDTYTLADGTVKTVKEGVPITREQAERDLERRIKTEFMPKVARQLGDDFAKLPPSAQAALTSVAYNYGSLPASVVRASKGGNLKSIANAVEALKSDDKGINARRRMEEANIIRNSSISGKESPILPEIIEPVKKRDPNLQSSLVNSSGTRVALAILPVKEEVVVTKTEIQTVPIPIETVTTIPEEWEVG